MRRSRAEVAEAGRRLAADAARMADPGVTPEPSPSAENCSACAYVTPCQALFAGQEAVPPCCRDTGSGRRISWSRDGWAAAPGA